MAESEPSPLASEPTEPKQWKGWLFALFADPIRLLTEPIKLPGWAAIVFAIFVFFPDWHARLDFWLHVATSAGGHMSTLAGAITSPYFSPALALAGVLWILFVGEPPGVQRHHWLRYVGWSVFAVCVTAVTVTAGYGAIEFYIRSEIAKGNAGVPRESSPGTQSENRPQRPLTGGLRHLLPDQRRIIVTGAEKLRNDFADMPLQVQYAMNDTESYVYMEDFLNSFSRAGVGTQSNPALPRGLDETGVIIRVADPKLPPLAAQKLYELLVLADINPRYAAHYPTGSPSNWIALFIGPSPMVR